MSLSCLLLFPGLQFILDKDLDLGTRGYEYMPLILQKIVAFLVMIGISGSYFALFTADRISFYFHFPYFLGRFGLSYILFFLLNSLYYLILFKLANFLKKDSALTKIIFVVLYLLLANVLMGGGVFSFIGL